MHPTAEMYQERRGMCQPTRVESYLNDQMCQFLAANRYSGEEKVLNELSQEERSQALYDVHGVMDTTEETQEFLEQKLVELDEELFFLMETNGLHGRNINYLKEAWDMSPAYVRQERLKHLRARNYSVRDAAKNMERFFELKWNIFGPSSLADPFCEKYLTPEDKQCFESGYFQIFPRRDNSGRVVIFWIGRLIHEFPIETTIRLSYTMLMKCFQDEDVQRKGCVMLYYGNGQTDFSRNLPFHFGYAWYSLPVKSAASHFSYDNPFMRPLTKLIQLALSATEACKFRAHYGTHIEVRYKLLTFGIPGDLYPVKDDGTIKPYTPPLPLLSDGNGSSDMDDGDNTEKRRPVHDEGTGNGVGKIDDVFGETIGDMDLSPKKMGNTSQQSEGVEATHEIDPRKSTVITVPGPFDVILGWNKLVHSSPGNLRLKHLLQERNEEYNNTDDKMEKVIIANFIYQSILSKGGRFVKKKTSPGDGVWEEVDETVALKKIAHDFRNMRREKKKTKKSKSKPKSGKTASRSSSLSSEKTATKQRVS